MFEAVFQCKLMLRARSCNWISGEEAFTKIKLHHEKLLRVGSGYNSMNILVDNVSIFVCSCFHED